MSGSVTSPSTVSAAGTAGSSSTTQATTALASNEQDFMKLLLTQLQNQDPSSPVDTQQFTSQLVQYATVEQQINTNSNLNQLINLTQADTMVQSSAIVGKRVEVQSDHLALQNGAAQVDITLAQAQPLTIDVYNAKGVKIAESTLDGVSGQNTWTWNGQDSNGNKVPDGSYKVAVTSATSGTTAAAVPFTVVGKATGVVSSGNAVQLEFGALAVDFSTVKSIQNTGA